MMLEKFRSITLPARLFCLWLLISGPSTSAPAQESSARPVEGAAEATLVRVNIITETQGKSETVIINGRRFPNYHPQIVQLFPSTGIVIDEQGHILAFLGYRWVEIQTGERRIEIISSQGQKFPGKMVGIDQSTGVAVVRSQGGKLARTPLCEACKLQDGVTVVVPVWEKQGESKLHRAQVVSVLNSGEAAGGGWEITINRTLPGIGEPLLDSEHRFLGYVAGQKPSPQDPLGVRTVVFPVGQLMNSAGKILKAGGDIHTGWLGVYLDNSGIPAKPGIRIKSVLEDSPAAQAGLRPEDVLVRWNDAPIRDALNFIRLVQDTTPGTKVDLAVLRGGRSLSIPAVIEARKEQPRKGSFFFHFPEEITVPNSRFEGEVTIGEAPSPDTPRMGIDIVALTAPLAKYLQLPVESGLMISAVDPKMSGARAGLMVGDVILAIDDLVILDPLEFSSYVRSRNWGNPVTLKILRSGAERAVKVQLRKPSNP